MSNETTTADGGVRKKGKLGQRIAYACGNLGQSAFYNAMSTYFIVYVTGCLFSGVDKALAAKLIGVITSLVVIIRIAEIFIDPLLGNLIDNTNTKWGRFRPWQFFGGLISGEHGIGFGKKGYLAEFAGPVNMRLMRGIKETFDPKMILNPGKICYDPKEEA